MWWVYENENGYDKIRAADLKAVNSLPKPQSKVKKIIFTYLRFKTVPRLGLGYFISVPPGWMSPLNTSFIFGTKSLRVR